MIDFQSLVEQKLEPTGSSGNDIIYRCPQCEGTEGSGHLYINYRKGYYHCFKCGFRGRRIESLLRYLKINTDFDYSKIYNERDKELDDIIFPKKDTLSKEVSEYSKDLGVLTAYYNQHIKGLSTQAYNYLINRGLTPSTIETLSIKEGISRYGEKFLINGKEYMGRDYSGRILVPSKRRDGLISFYVARDYIGDKKPKYLNPPSELAIASEDVWNLDMVDSDSVIICEGVFTSIASSPIKLNAVATYGKSIAVKSSSDVRVTSQGEKLLNRKFKNYYVAYDADARSEAIKTCQYLNDRGANVYLVTIDPNIYGQKADVADIGYTEFLKLLSSAKRYDSKINGLTFDL